MCTGDNKDYASLPGLESFQPKVEILILSVVFYKSFRFNSIWFTS